MSENYRREWLSIDIIKEYQQKAKQIQDYQGQDIGKFRELRIELMHRCGITEIEAINILNGYHGMDYIRKYEILRGEAEGMFMDEKARKRRDDYMRWLAEQEEAERLQKILDTFDGQ